MNKSVHEVYLELCNLWDDKLFYDFLHPDYIKQEELRLVSHLSDPIGILNILRSQYINK